MKRSRISLMSALIPFLSQTMHIENSHTIIKFNKQKKPLYEWIRDDQKKEFGNTTIIMTKTNEPPFIKSGTIKTLKPKEFQLITAGCSFYCHNIKNKNGIEYGAIVINPQHYYFDREIARKITLQLKNSYLETQLIKSLNEKIALEDEIEEINQKKNKFSSSGESTFEKI